MPGREEAGFVFLGLRFSKQLRDTARRESCAAHRASLPGFRIPVESLNGRDRNDAPRAVHSRSKEDWQHRQDNPLSHYAGFCPAN